MKYKGKLHIGRISGSREYVTIELTDEISSTRVFEIELSLEAFGDAVTGRGQVPCIFEVNDSRVGWKPEYKEEIVELKSDLFKREDREEAAKKALKEFEKDGWVGRLDDALNHHCRVGSSKTGSGSLYRVHFYRYVKP